MRTITATLTLLAIASAAAAAESLEGRWRLVAAEDVRDNGEFVRHPWGEHTVGSLVVQGGWLYLQIMATDVPSFAQDKTGEQMKAMLFNNYIAYAGPVTIDEAAGGVSFKVEAAWRPDYVGTDQKRIFHFERGKLIFGTIPNSIRMGSERLTRKLTFERVQ